jgi:predicted  nucleic acid-binding Zn-ribbon protein
MFACFDVVIFEVIGYKTPRLKAKHEERSKARQKIREERKQTTKKPADTTPEHEKLDQDIKRLEQEAEQRVATMKEKRRQVKTSKTLYQQK